MATFYQVLSILPFSPSSSTMEANTGGGNATFNISKLAVIIERPLVTDAPHVTMMWNDYAIPW